MIRARTIAFPSGPLSMQGELVLPEGPVAVLAILCHGLPGARPDSDPGYAGFARQFAEEAGIGAFWFDFRGTRSSPGDFSLEGWVDDVGGALDALATHPEVDAAVRVIVGSSAGGAVAILAASRRPELAGIVTLAAPARWGWEENARDQALARLRNMSLIRDPAFPRDPDQWWAELSENTAERAVASVAPRPLLIVHGDADEVVPYTNAEQIFSAAAPPKELARIPGGAHQLRKDPRARDCVFDWISRHFPGASG